MGLGELYGHSFMEAWGKNITIQGTGFSGDTDYSQGTSVCLVEITEP